MLFKEKLDKIVKKNKSLLCLGLDSEFEKIPEPLKKNKYSLFAFNKTIVDATHDLVCAYKPNIAFYEAYGLDGLLQLKKTLDYLRKNYPEIPLVLDAKRGDIGNTARMYAQAIFDYWQVDAVTCHPNLGLDSLVPFLEYKEKLIILLIKTSNPDAKMFQDIACGGQPYYLYMAKKIQKWTYENIGLFVGATYPDELKKMRALFPDKIFLSAGIGAQRAEIGRAVKAGIDKNKGGIMFNASRSIIYASSGRDFAQAAKAEAERLKNLINLFRT